MIVEPLAAFSLKRRFIHRINLEVNLVIDLDAEDGAGVGQRGTPRPGSRFGGDMADARFPVVKGLRYGRVRLVAPGRANPFIFEIDACRSIKCFLKSAGTVQGRRTPLPVDFPDRLRDLDLALRRDLLGDQRHREQRRQVVRADRFQCARMQNRGRRHGEVGGQVVPEFGDAFFGENVLYCVVHGKTQSLSLRTGFLCWRGHLAAQNAALVDLSQSPSKIMGRQSG